MFSKSGQNVQNLTPNKFTQEDNKPLLPEGYKVKSAFRVKQRG